LIFIDTNIVSETLKPHPAEQVIQWLSSNDATIALPSIVLAELAYGIERIRPDERAGRLEKGLDAWRDRFRDRIFAFGEEEALVYGALMGKTARNGRPMSVPDGMIAAMAVCRGWQLATRNTTDFDHLDLYLIDPFKA
jgi:predicted nucleic acid-binding protein